jgi:exosome complex RNA-binding protein Rrp42 (RNase PH superfamily)
MKRCEVTTNVAPVSLTTGLYRGRLIVDPNSEEEALMEALVTVCVDDSGAVVAVLKPGGDAEATETQIAHCVAAARARRETCANAMRDAFS